MTIVFTVFEYIVSFIFELIFGIRWWDYSNELLNINGRVCLNFSLLWGIVTIIFIKYCYSLLQSIVKKLRDKVSSPIISTLLIVLSIGTLIDFILSIIRYVK